MMEIKEGWAPEYLFLLHSSGPPLFEEFYTPAYQQCMWQNGVPPAWVLEKPSPGSHFCFAVSVVFIVKRETDWEKGKQMDGLACWQSVLQSQLFIFDFDGFRKKEVKGKENQKEMSCRKEGR